MVCIHCLEVLILTYSDFTIDNVNFDYKNAQVFKINIATFRYMSCF